MNFYQIFFCGIGNFLRLVRFFPLCNIQMRFMGLLDLYLNHGTNIFYFFFFFLHCCCQYVLSSPSVACDWPFWSDCFSYLSYLTPPPTFTSTYTHKSLYSSWGRQIHCIINIFTQLSIFYLMLIISFTIMPHIITFTKNASSVE